MDLRNKAADRLIRYAKIMTPSNAKSQTVPSSICQFDLAHVLVEELRQMGIDNAYADDKCYVYASIPATEGKENCPAIGFIAHMDTVSDYTRTQVTPLVWENYDGRNLALPGGRVIRAEYFPHLSSLAGKTLITSDGNTILGADDKAGVAEIMTLAEYILQSDLPHGKICIGFTPDEEIGRGARYFDVEGFGADYAFTVDGGKEGSIEYENFNGADAVFTIHGKGIHPGDAKGIMINASLVAIRINEMIPEDEIPAKTSGYEGYFHLCGITGHVESAKVHYTVRDHDSEKYRQRLALLRDIEKTMNETYGYKVVELVITERYRNMKEKIMPHFHLIENAMKASSDAGCTPVSLPIRGGTDGAVLSYKGLPCPNLGTGGYAFHGPYEHITAEGMGSVVRILLEIVKIYSTDPDRVHS